MYIAWLVKPYEDIKEAKGESSKKISRTFSFIRVLDLHGKILNIMMAAQYQLSCIYGR
jgi:hypothetical protein